MSDQQAVPLPVTPPEFDTLLLSAIAIVDAQTTLGQEPTLLVRAFPPRSWLWPNDPDGWSVGTDTWNINLRPYKVDQFDTDQMVWKLEYTDDDGNHEFGITVEHALDLVKLQAPTVFEIPDSGMADTDDPERPRPE